MLLESFKAIIHASRPLPISFYPRKRCAGNSHHSVSVCLSACMSVCHMPVLYQNG